MARSEEDIIAAESGGQPYIGWGGVDLSKRPLNQYGFPIWEGKMGPAGISHAAGIYQFEPATWAEGASALGISDFSPQSQKKVYDWTRAKYGDAPWAASAGGKQREGYYGGAQHINVKKDIPPEDNNTLLLYAGILDALGGPGGKEDTSKPALGTLQADMAGQPTKGATARTKPEQGDELLNAIKDNLDRSHPPNQLTGQPIPGIPDLSGPQPPMQQMAGDVLPFKPAILPGIQGGPEGTTIDLGGGSGMHVAPPLISPGQYNSMPDTEPSLRYLLRHGAANEANAGPQPPQDATAGLYNGVLNVLKQMNPIGSAQAAGLPLPKQPQQPAPAPTPAQPLPRASDALKPSAALPADPQWSEIEQHIKSALEPFQRTESQKDLDITTPEGFRQAALSPESLDKAISVAMSFGPGAIGKLPGPSDLREASKNIQKVFSPTTVDPTAQAAETLFRETTGIARGETSRAEAKVGTRGPLTNPGEKAGLEAFRKEPWRPLVAQHIPEFQQYLAAVKGGATPLRKPELLRFLDFVETRSSGAAYGGPPELRPLADILRDIYKDRAAQIAAEPSTQWAGFVDDYAPHMWKDKNASSTWGAGSGGQGSGRNLKQRSIPTISDGIAQGLTPASLDPIEMMMKYVGNIDRYLAHNAIFRVAKDGGMIKFFPPGQIPDGWAPLTGRLAERAVATGGQPGALGMTAAAPEGFARVYNNGIRTGFFEDPIGGNVYEAILRGKNAITQFSLSLSGFHMLAMLQEAGASSIASGIQHLKAGDIGPALRDLGLGAMPLVKGVKDVVDTGRKMERQYAGIQDYGPTFSRMVDLWERAGGQGSTRGREWQASEAGNFATSIKRGTALLETKAGLRDIANKPHIGSQSLAALRFTADQLGRVMDTVTAPLFDVMIPRLKKAAFYDEMSEWVRQHPTASVGEQVAQSRRVMDTIEDRYGELVMDNVFWGQKTKQFLQLATVSMGWELGSIRSLTGAPLDLVRGVDGQFRLGGNTGKPVLGPRVRYTLGLATAIAVGNSVYQYLMTGKTPGQDTGGVLSKGGALDLALPRTGGTTPEGAYERALTPGFEKDILGYSYNFPYGIPVELAGKLSGLGRLMVEGYTGRDTFTGRPIVNTPNWFSAWADHIMTSMRPITTKQDIYKGSAIPPWQRYMGIRPAAERYQNPERIEDIEHAVRLKNLDAERRALIAHGARTTQEPKYIQQRLKEIQDEKDAVEKDYQETIKADRANHDIHFPPKGGGPGLKYDAPKSFNPGEKPAWPRQKPTQVLQ